MKNKKAARPKGKRAVGARKKKERLKPVSLHPLSFEDAMRALVPPSRHSERKPDG
jgi:hypothetical protein